MLLLSASQCLCEAQTCNKVSATVLAHERLEARVDALHSQRANQQAVLGGAALTAQQRYDRLQRGLKALQDDAAVSHCCAHVGLAAASLRPQVLSRQRA